MSFSLLSIGQCSFSDLTSSICSGEEINLLAEPSFEGLQYTWAAPSILPIGSITGFSSVSVPAESFSQTLVNQTNSPATATYLVTVSSINCAPVSFQIQITVNPIPTVDLVPNQELCAGEQSAPIVFSSPNAGTSFSTWINSNSDIGLASTGTGNISAFNTLNTFTGPITSSITTTPLANNCFGEPTVVTSFTINPRPQINNIGSLSFCEGETVESINFSSNIIQAEYTWMNSQVGIGLPSSGNDGIDSFTAENQTNEILEAQINVLASAFGCISNTPEAFSIIVRPTPTLFETTSQSVCHGGFTESIVIDGFVENTFIANWSFSEVIQGLEESGGSSIIESQQVFNYGSAPISAQLSATAIANGCLGVSQVITDVTVRPQVIVTNLSDLTICAGELVLIDPFQLSAANAEIEWEADILVPGMTSQTGNGDLEEFTVDQSISESGTATFFVQAREPGCILGDEAQFSVIYHPLPEISFEGVISNIEVCHGEEIDFPNVNSSLNGTSFSYSLDGNLDLVQGQESGAFPPAPIFSIANNTIENIHVEMDIIGSYFGCESAPIQLPIIVKPRPRIRDNTSLLLCNQESFEGVEIEVLPENTTGSWDANSTLSGVPQSGIDLLIPPFVAINNSTALSTSYLYFSLESENGCLANDTLVLSVAPDLFSPNASFNIENIGDSLFLCQLVDDSYINISDWYVNNEFVQSGGGLVFIPQSNGDYDIKCVIFSICGSDSVSQTVTVALKIPENLSVSEHIYPNPAKQFINIPSSLIQTKSTIQIQNLQGALVYEYQYSQASGDYAVNLSNLKPGTYILRITQASHIRTFLFQKL